MNALIRFATIAARDEALNHIRENAPDIARCLVCPNTLPDLVVRRLPDARAVELKHLVGDDASWYEDIQFESF